MSYHQGPADQMLITQHIAAQVAAANVDGAAIDMAGWSGCLFVISLGDFVGAAVLDAFVQRDDNSGFNSAANVANAALVQVANTGENNVVMIDVWRPSERYIRLRTVPAVNSVPLGVTAIRYRGSGLLPPTQTATQYVKIAEG